MITTCRYNLKMSWPAETYKMFAPNTGGRKFNLIQIQRFWLLRLMWCDQLYHLTRKDTVGFVELSKHYSLLWIIWLMLQSGVSLANNLWLSTDTSLQRKVDTSKISLWPLVKILVEFAFMLYRRISDDHPPPVPSICIEKDFKIRNTLSDWSCWKSLPKILVQR